MRDKTKAYSFPSSILICLHYWVVCANFFSSLGYCCCCSSFLFSSLWILILGCTLLFLSLPLARARFIHRRFIKCVSVYSWRCVFHSHSYSACQKSVFNFFLLLLFLNEYIQYVYGYMGHYVMCVCVWERKGEREYRVCYIQSELSI